MNTKVLECHSADNLSLAKLSVVAADFHHVSVSVLARLLAFVGSDISAFVNAV